MRILAIETSCDETAIALLEAVGGLARPKFKIIENLVASQIKVHAPFGGVVPGLAKREHIKNLPLLLNTIEKKHNLKQADLICVTVGPGLEPALWTGIEFAKGLYKKLKQENQKVRLIGVSHLEGHLYSNLLAGSASRKKNKKGKEMKFPAISLLVSGGHTLLLHMEAMDKYYIIGETRDDAVGEAFDKVARLLGLPYPGGPAIEVLAKKGNADAIAFPRPMLYQKNYDFSFSGLKTSVLYYMRQGAKSAARSTKDIAASFQKAAFEVLVVKTMRASRAFRAKIIFLSGGVAANRTLRASFRAALRAARFRPVPLFSATEFPTDNAAMIGAAGYIAFLRKRGRRLVARGNITM